MQKNVITAQLQDIYLQKYEVLTKCYTAEVTELQQPKKRYTIHER